MGCTVGGDLQVFIDSFEDGVLVIDRNYRVQHANQVSRLKLIGADVSVIGRRCCEVLPCHQRPDVEVTCDCPAMHVFLTGHPERLTWHCELNGEIIWMDVVASPLFDAAGNIDRVVEVWRDISEMKRLEDWYQRRVQELSALRLISDASSRTLSTRQILDDSLALVIEILRADAGGTYLLDADSRVLRLRAYRSISAEVAEDIDYLEIGEGFSGQVVETGEPVIANNVPTDPRLTRKTINREALHALLAVPLISTKGAFGSLWVAVRHVGRSFVPSERDWLTAVARQLALAIENARLYEEVHERDVERRELLGHMIRAQEEERKRVARGLHDDVMQSLARLAVDTDGLRKQLTADCENLQEPLLGFKNSIWAIMDGIHRVILDIRPGLLDDLGLVPALRWYAEEKLRALGVDLTCDFTDVGAALSSEQETGLFRVMQEAINNIAEHSGALHVHLALLVTGDSVQAVASDDGHGFDPNEQMDFKTSTRGLGLLGMRERVALMGGRLQIASAPTDGTRVSVKIATDRREKAGD
jgi:signal transduction histidine kinase